MDFQAKLGYDYVTVWPRNLNFPTAGQGSARDTASLAHDHRTFNLAGQGVLRDWADFERYPWPDPAGVDYQEIAEAAACMPEGMKGYRPSRPRPGDADGPDRGTEGLSYAVYDEPDLVAAVFERVGTSLRRFTWIWPGWRPSARSLISDDLAFKRPTLMLADFLRRYVFPWNRRSVEIGHAKGIPVTLHSCGNLKAGIETDRGTADRRQALV